MAGACKSYIQVSLFVDIADTRPVAAYIVLAPGYSSPAYRWARTSVFLGLGLCGVVPVIHGFFTIGFERMRHEMGVLWLVLSGAFYIVGALT